MSGGYRLPSPHILRHTVRASEIDEYRHVNNAVYLIWLDRCAWSHSAALGMPLSDCVRLRRGMAVKHTRVDYLQAALEHDRLGIGTWLIESDGRLRCRRRFEILRHQDGARILEAEIDYVCLNLDSGRPVRFPKEFAACYRADPEVSRALSNLAAEFRQIGGVGAARDDR